MNILKNLFSGGVPSVSAKEAQDMLKGDSAPFLLDVREKSEFASGHIQGAKLIPLGELGARQNELPQGRTILCVCRSGSRSGMAARQLASAGYTVRNLSGGMMSWQMAGLPVKKGK